MKFKVKVQHYGDRQYMPGDEREAAEADVRHLVDAGTLEPVRSRSSDSKSEGAAPKNKAVGPAPENKSSAKGKAD